jgi:DNA repair exonuclease SbcCD ATPase subunit
MPEPEPWQLILSAIGRVEQRVDKLVTTETHQADIRRIDERVADLIADLGQEAARRSEDRAEQSGKIEALRQALQSEGDNRRTGDERDLEAIRTELAREREQRKRDRQWLAMAIIGVLGIMVAAVALVLP